MTAALIGRRVRRRLRPKIGFLRIPAPTLDCVDVVHGGYLTDRRPESLAWCRQRLRALLVDHRVECITLLHLAEEHPAYPELTRGLLDGRRVHASPTAHWRSTLLDPVSGERVERHSSRTRQTFRRKDRKLREHFGGDVVVREMRSPADVEGFIAIASGIGARSYQGGIDVGVRDDVRWRTLLGALAQQNRMSGHVLVAGGEPVAYTLGSIHRSTYTLIATSFLPEHRALSPGAYLLRAVIEELAEKGIATLDFGFGDSEYKRLHGTTCTREHLMRFFGPSPRARTAEALSIAAAAARRMVEPLAERTGIRATVKRAWRRRLEQRA